MYGSFYGRKSASNSFAGEGGAAFAR